MRREAREAGERLRAQLDADPVARRCVERMRTARARGDENAHGRAVDAYARRVRIAIGA